MEQLVSIIVPVYNTGAYLAPCIESLISQTHRNLEIILVDDGSTDGSGGVCDDFAHRDGRVKVIHQKNGGVSRARNHGLDVAAGEWILFVDSDDQVLPEYCAQMLSATLEQNADAVIARPAAEGLPMVQRYTPEQTDLLKRACMAYDEMGFDYNIDGPWGKIFRRSVIEGHGIRFPEQLARSEDAWFCATFYEYAQKLCCLNWFGYIHNERPGSLCRRFAPDAPDMLERILEENRAWAERHHPGEQPYLDAVCHRVLNGIVECESQYFLHPSFAGSVWSRTAQYQRFLNRPGIRSALRGIDPNMVSGRQLRLRLGLYRAKLGWLFLLLKQNRK